MRRTKGRECSCGPLFFYGLEVPDPSELSVLRECGLSALTEGCPQRSPLCPAEVVLIITSPLWSHSPRTGRASGTQCSD